jgi:hypothetical protein
MTLEKFTDKTIKEYLGKNPWLKIDKNKFDSLHLFLIKKLWGKEKPVKQLTGIELVEVIEEAHKNAANSKLVFKKETKTDPINEGLKNDYKKYISMVDKKMTVKKGRENE